jgi:hypothetical protein
VKKSPKFDDDGKRKACGSFQVFLGILGPKTGQSIYLLKKINKINFIFLTVSLSPFKKYAYKLILIFVYVNEIC